MKVGHKSLLCTEGAVGGNIWTSTTTNIHVEHDKLHFNHLTCPRAGGLPVLFWWL